jgi:membrane associated rhomboid family serine protease
MSQTPPDAQGTAPEGSEVTYCYGHPDTPTRLRCTRCDKPICPRCSVPASVGQHCVWCVAESRKSAPKVKSALRAGSPAVMSIIAICVAVYILEFLMGDPFVLRFASSPRLIAAGDWYRLLTPMFLHAPLGSQFGIVHILFNMYILRVYGQQVEEAYGAARFVILFLVTGFMGNVASYAFGACNTLGLGASGAIFGIVGVLLVLLYNRRTSSFVATYMQSLLVFVGINLVFGFVVAGVDNLAHIGGLVSGLALGLGYDNVPPGPQGKARQLAVTLLVVAVGIALVVWRTAEINSGGCFP